ncbi:MAG: class F sortase [Candidatus Liptonbacteria bacterium]
MKSAILISLGVGLLTAGLSVFIQTRSQTWQVVPIENPSPVTEVESLVENNPKPVATTTADMGIGSSFDVPALPARLNIPAIGVSAKIQSVGLSWRNDGTMGIPTNFTDVAWYNLGPRPGMPGSAVIAGHLDGKKVKEAVFYNLGNLKSGDLVEVADGMGKVSRFQVVDSKIYEYNATTTDIFSNDASKTRLNLITCTGDWIKGQKIYDKRIVVFTEFLTTN